jgi:tetrapyrrole methylase family protein/MazG family protein
MKLNTLIEITKRLRAEDGCPWDKKQTLKTLRPYVIEEAYEVVDAISKEDYVNLKEEAGDLLLQVLFIANIAQESNLFHLEDILQVLSDKLIRRHPHVFGDRKVGNAEEALSVWNEQKSLENKGEEKEFSLTLPSLLRAVEISKAYSKLGLEFPSSEDILEKLQSEIREFEEVVETQSSEGIEEELGDILFTVANLCRTKKVNPEMVLNRSSDKFVERAKFFLDLKKKGLPDDEAWKEAKLLFKKMSK